MSTKTSSSALLLSYDYKLFPLMPIFGCLTVLINMTKRILYKAFLALLLFSVACVDPYLATFTGEATIFVVDARLTNDPSVNYVSITEAIPSGESSTTFLGVGNATVNVVIDEATTIPLKEISAGRYEFPNGFSGEIGRNYKLEFTTSDGRFFESKPEHMLETPEIEKVYDTFDEDAVKTVTETSPGFNVYVDTKDPGEEKNFYMWDWRYYEKQLWCKTCIDGYYYNDASTGSLGECRSVRFRRGPADYNCSSPCWQIFRSEKFNIMNDDFSNGQLVKDRLVASIPLYTFEGALLEVRQYNISEDAYDYLRLVISQGQETGGLADTPPATLEGNIISSNPDQPVTGYFIVTSVTKILHWMDKRNVQANVPARSLFTERRFARPEPASNDTTRPPLAPCLAKDNRTSTTPTGWLFGEN